MLLDEATEKEHHFESSQETHVTEIHELRGELQRERESAVFEKNQIIERIEGLQEQLEAEKGRYDKEF